MNKPENRAISLAVGLDKFGLLTALAIGTSNDFWHTREEHAVGSGGWTDWTLLGKPTNKGISLAVKKRNDNLLEAFAIGTSNDFWHTIQRDPSTGLWSDWETLGNSIKSGISSAVENRKDGMLEVFAIDMSFDFWHIWQMGTGPRDWSDWTRLGTSMIKGQKVVVAMDKTDRLQVFAIDTSNRVWHKHQNDPGRNDWSDWTRLGEGLAWYKAISLAVATNNDGRLEVFAIDITDHFWHIWQTIPDLDLWANDWVRLGGQSDRGTSLAVERNGSGALEAFAITTDAVGVHPSSPAPRDIRHIWQTGPGPHDWSDWTSLEDPV